MLQRIDVVAAQDRYSADHFRRLGVVAERLHVTGSVKYDGALADREHPRVVALRNLLRFPAETIVWIAGSTQAPEERVVIDIFAALRRRFPLLRLLLVPRHPQRFPEVAELLDQGPFHWQRRSSVQRPGDADASAPIWLIDSVGELAAWWGVADLATVGGSFGDRGGQNMIEPAAYGAAVSFGPHTENFRDIVRALLSAEAAFRADDFGELQRFVARCLEDAEHRAAFGRRARCLVAEQQGATQRTADLLDGLLTQEGPKKTRAAA